VSSSLAYRDGAYSGFARAAETPFICSLDFLGRQSPRVELDFVDPTVKVYSLVLTAAEINRRSRIWKPTFARWAVRSPVTRSALYLTKQLVDTTIQRLLMAPVCTA
jgi:hypothetical protein